MIFNEYIDPRFWRNLTKKDSIERAKYEITNFPLVLTVLGHSFSSWIQIFPSSIRIAICCSGSFDDWTVIHGRRTDKATMSGRNKEERANLLVHILNNGGKAGELTNHRLTRVSRHLAHHSSFFKTISESSCIN